MAVLAYTGYDMEDAMILNKSSMERGLAHGSMYKVECVDLREDKKSHSCLGAELPEKAQVSCCRLVSQAA